MRFWIIEIGEPIAGIDGNSRDWHCGMLAKALVAHGHTVVLWSSTFNHQSKTQRFPQATTVAIAPGLEIRFLYGAGYKTNKSLARWFHHRAVASAFAHESVHAQTPDLVFCSLPTLELCEQAISYGTRFVVPVILDVADVWPDHYLTMVPRFGRRLLRLLLSTEFQRARRVLSEATGITAVSQTYLNWALAAARRERRSTDGVFPLAYPHLSPEMYLRVDEASQRLAQKYNFVSNECVVTFVGTFTSSFDLDTVLEVARTFQQTQMLVRFVFVGAGDNSERLRVLANDLQNVVFTGWFDHVYVAAILKLSTIGIAPYRDDASMTLPNKPFEYMAAGLPILSSLKGELEQLIHQEGIGLQYCAHDSIDLIEKIRWFVSNPEATAAMGERAYKLFEERYSADVVNGSLVKHLETVIEARKCPLLQEGYSINVDHRLKAGSPHVPSAPG